MTVEFWPKELFIWALVIRGVERINNMESNRYQIYSCLVALDMLLSFALSFIYIYLNTYTLQIDFGILGKLLN